MRQHRTIQSQLRPTQRRISALWALIDQPSKSLNCAELNKVAGYADERVLLLSLAECAMFGLVEISNGLITVTSNGVIFAQENIEYITNKKGERLTWNEIAEA